MPRDYANAAYRAPHLPPPIRLGSRGGLRDQKDGAARNPDVDGAVLADDDPFCGDALEGAGDAGIGTVDAIGQRRDGIGGGGTEGVAPKLDGAGLTDGQPGGLGAVASGEGGGS